MSFFLFLGALVVLLAGAVIYALRAFDRAANDRADAAVAKKDAAAAVHRSDEAVKAQETRDAVNHSSFDDAVDGL